MGHVVHVRAVLAALATLSMFGSAGAQSAPDLRAAAYVESYVDTDNTAVTRPRVSLDARVAERFRLAATYTADVVSSASIDVVTRATQRIHELRHDGTASVTLLGADGERTTIAYAVGHEPDFASHAASASHTRYLDAARRTELAVRGSASHGRIGSVADASFRRSVVTATANASVARILSVDRLLRVSAEFAAVEGFQSSAYRTVRLGNWTASRYDGTDPLVGVWVFAGVTQAAREHHPDQRYRARVASELLQAFGRSGAVLMSAAAYVDSWLVRAFELALEVRWEPRPALLFRLGGRAYVQSAAWFFRRRYEDVSTTRGYLTDDKELGPMRSYEVHAALQVPIGPVRLDGRVELDAYRYPALGLLPEKYAVVSSLGIVVVR